MSRPKASDVPAYAGPQCDTPTWTCDSCGATGEVLPGETSDQVLCDTCGEPVLPDDQDPR